MDEPMISCPHPGCKYNTSDGTCSFCRLGMVQMTDPTGDALRATFRNKHDRIERLRQRLQQISIDPKLAGVIKGILDLLADEL